MNNSFNPLSKDFTLPPNIRKIGIGPIFIILFTGFEVFSIIGSAVIRKIIYGEIPLQSLITGATLPILLAPIPLFLLLRSIFTLDEMKREYQHLSQNDVLTEAYNRRYLMAQLEKEIERSKRYNTSFSLVMMDCDNFKMINDTYGHPVGDQYLIHLATICKERLRTTDTLARIGGDEFMLLLPETTGEKALQLAEVIRETTLNSFELFKDEPDFNSLSMGVITWHSSIKNSTRLLIMLDNALYAAKERGKNCVVYQKAQN